MSHKEAEEIAAEIAWMQDDPSFQPKIKNKKTNEKIIIKDYHKYWVYDSPQGHLIKICFGNDEVIELDLRWKNRNRDKHNRVSNVKIK